MLVWIVALIGALGFSGSAAESVEGTWKVREPLTLEIDGELCAVRRGVAHLTQTGATVTGRYEAEFACWSPYAPQIEWGPRHGQLVGRVEGNEFTAQLFMGDPFPLHIRGTFDGNVLHGSFDLGDFVAGEWSAGKIVTGRPIS